MRVGRCCVWHRDGVRWHSERQLQLGENSGAMSIASTRKILPYPRRDRLWCGNWRLAGNNALWKPIRIGRSETSHLTFRMDGWPPATESRTRLGRLGPMGTRHGHALHQEEMPSLGHSYVNGIDIAPRGSRMAIGFDEAILVYEMSSYQRTNFLGFDSTKAIAFSPTTPFLAATNIRGSITVWNSVTNRPVATLHHPRQRVSRDDLVFSGDGTQLASSNADSIQVWNLTRADERTVMIGHDRRHSLRGVSPARPTSSDGRQG